MRQYGKHEGEVTGKWSGLRTPVLLLILCASLEIVLRQFKYNHRVVTAVIYLLVFHALVRIAGVLLDKIYLTKQKVQIPKLAHNIFIAIIYFVAVFTVLKMQLGIDITPLITTSAVLSIVLGLALQDTLTNFFAGVVIHIESPFRLGDWVMVNHREGKVVEINWRTTKILTNENNFLVIPNSAIVKDTIENFHYPAPLSIIRVYMGASYDIPPNKVKDTILRVVDRMDDLLKTPEPEVRLNKYGDFAIEYEIRIWTNDYGRKFEVSNVLYTNIWYAFKRKGIKIPFPVRDVYIHNTGGHDLDQKCEENFHLLSRIEFFEGLPEDILRQMCNIVTRRHYGKNEVLFYEGDKGDSFFIVFQGKVAIIKAGEQVAELGRASFFGEMSLFTGNDRSATVKALEDSDFLVLGKDEFSGLIMENVDMLEKIGEVVAKREMENEKLKERLNGLADKEITMSAEEQAEINKIKILAKIKRFFNLI